MKQSRLNGWGAARLAEISGSLRFQPKTCPSGPLRDSDFYLSLSSSQFRSAETNRLEKTQKRKNKPGWGGGENWKWKCKQWLLLKRLAWISRTGRHFHITTMAPVAFLGEQCCNSVLPTCLGFEKQESLANNFLDLAKWDHCIGSR